MFCHQQAQNITSSMKIKKKNRMQVCRFTSNVMVSNINKTVDMLPHPIKSVIIIHLFVIRLSCLWVRIMVLESVGFYSTVLWILHLCYWLKKCYFAEFTNIMFAFSFCVDGIFLRLQSLTFLQGHTYTTSNTFLVSVFVNVCTFSFYQWLYTSFPFYSTLLSFFLFLSCVCHQSLFCRTIFKSALVTPISGLTTAPLSSVLFPRGNHLKLCFITTTKSGRQFLTEEIQSLQGYWYAIKALLTILLKSIYSSRIIFS